MVLMWIIADVITTVHELLQITAGIMTPSSRQTLAQNYTVMETNYAGMWKTFMKQNSEVYSLDQDGFKSKLCI